MCARCKSAYAMPRCACGLFYRSLYACAFGRHCAGAHIIYMHTHCTFTVVAHTHRTARWAFDIRIYVIHLFATKRTSDVQSVLTLRPSRWWPRCSDCDPECGVSKPHTLLHRNIAKNHAVARGRVERSSRVHACVPENK